MASRDILVLNTTASRAETQQGSDTVVIRGNSGEALSVENSSGTSILSVNTVSSSVDVAGKITATTNVSSSITSTGSFGRVEATTLVGDAFNLTGTAIDGTISSSGQIASQISGAFRGGFEFDGTIGSVAGHTTTASFDRIVATVFSGSAANLTNTALNGTLSSSAQIASRISGSFNKGFEFTGTISGSATSTGSFGQLFAKKAVGNVSAMTNLIPTNTVSSSAQLATAISGSFNKGFEYEGTISGSATSTGSFSNIQANKVFGDVSGLTGLIPSGIVSSSAQIASYVSGSFNKGFEFSGHISGSDASTGSFGRVEVTSISGDGSNLTGTALTGTISSSGQIASQISGAFTSGFTFSGDITTKDVVFSSGGDLNCTEDYNRTTYRGAAGNKNAGLIYGGYKFGYGSDFREHGCTEEYDGTTWTEKNDMIDSGGTSGGGTTEAAIATGGVNRCGCTEYWNGTNWSEVNDQILNNLNTSTFKTLSIGQSSDAIVITGFDYQSPYGHTEEWNGTNWATANRANHSVKLWHGGAGTANAGITAGGPFGSNVVSCTEEWNGTNWTEGPSALISNMKAVSMAGSQNDTLLAGFVQNSTFQPNNLLNNPNTNSADTICWNGLSWATSATLGVRRFGMSAAGQNTNVAFFASGLENASPYKAECTIEVETFVATASFSHIEALRITGSVDLMTNINPPEGAISGAAQIASSVSGSFNKGFEFSGEIKSFGAWSQGACFTGNYSHTYGRPGYGATGTRDAAIVSGASGIYTGHVTETYCYNGVTWSDSGHDMITGGSHSVHGTANAALHMGRHQRAPGTGQLYACTEEYNGSSWSETTDLPYPLMMLNQQSAGTQNAAITAGGNCDYGQDLDAIKRHALAWDGLSYNHVGTLAEARDNAGLVGTMNAALAQGGGSNSEYGRYTGHSTCTEEWNGSVWSTAAASNFPTGCVVMTAGKSSNDAMHVFNHTNSAQQSDFYNGTTWNLGPNMINDGSYNNAGSAGTAARSFFMSRNRDEVEHFDENHVTSSIGRVDATELSLESNTDLTVNESLQIPLYDGNPPVTSSAGEVWYNTAEEKLYFTYDINSWSEVADLISPKSFTFGSAGAGTGDALFYGGYAPYPTTTATTELWNGSAWSEVADLQDNVVRVGGTGCSTNAAVTVGNPTVNSAETNVWDGTSWTEVNDHITNRGCTSMSGTANAALLAPGVASGGSGSPTTEEWNGTNWSTSTNASLSYGQYDSQMIGTQNDTVKGVGPPQQANAAHYDGTSWASINPYSTPVASRAGFGTANAAIYAGGYYLHPSHNVSCAQTEEYNGISWKSVSSLGQGRGYGGRAGTQSSGMLSGGNYGTPNIRHCGNTEQYTTTGIGCACIGGV